MDIVIGVKAANVAGGSWERAVNLHAAVEVVVDDEVVRHADAVRLHWVALAVVVIADSWFVKVRDSALLSVGAYRRQRSPAFYVAIATLLSHHTHSMRHRFLSLSLFERR